MKQILFLAVLALGIPALAQSKVVLTWTSGNTGTNALPTCPATNPTSCVSGFTLSMDGTQIAGPTVLGVTATTFTQTTLPAVGTHNYSLLMNGFDGLGNPVASSPATASVNIPAPVTLNPPTGFKVVIQ